MKSKLEKSALIAEIAGGTAIIFTLFFVGLQLRASTKATKSATAAATVSDLNSWYSNLGNSEHGAHVFYTFMNTPDSLNPEDRFMAIMNMHGAMLTYQNSYFLVKEGTLDKEVQESLVEIIHGIGKNPGFELFWKIRKPLFRKDFQYYVDQIIKSEKDKFEGVYELESEQ